MYKIIFITVFACVCFSNSAYSSGLGDFGGKKCPYDKLSFRDNGNVFITMFGMEALGEYMVDGDKVDIKTKNGSVVFTKKGESLEMGMMGQKVVCQKMVNGKVIGEETKKSQAKNSKWIDSTTLNGMLEKGAREASRPVPACEAVKDDWDHNKSEQARKEIAAATFVKDCKSQGLTYAKEWRCENNRITVKCE